MDHRPVRRALLFSALVALIGASCGTSQGVQQASTVTLEGIGVTPRQLGEQAALPTEPPVTTASAITQPDLPPLTDPRVFMVGDSVLLATTQGRPDALDAYVGSLGWQITVDARVSRFTDEGLRVLRKRRAEVHEVAVVMLGNNYGGDEAQFAAQIDEMLQLLDGVRVVVMFTVPLYETKQQEVNAVLRQAAAADNRIQLIDWEGYILLNPSVLSDDGVHPTSYGAEVIAQLIGITLGRAPGADPTVPLPVLGASTRPAVNGPTGDKGESSPSEGGGGTGGRAPTTTRPRPRPTTTTTATTAAPVITVPIVTTAPPPASTQPATTAPPAPSTTPAPATNPPTPTATAPPTSV
jgi:lysophospholipase L1-like esterase